MEFTFNPSPNNSKGRISKIFGLLGRILWGFILFLFWAGFLGWALYDGYQSWGLVTNGESTIGTVISFQEIHETDGPNTFKSMIQYQVGNQRYIFVSSNSSSPPAHQLGEKVELFYSPIDPEIAQINSWYELWFFPGIITLVFLVVPIIVLFLKSGNLIVKKLSSQY